MSKKQVPFPINKVVPIDTIKAHPENYNTHPPDQIEDLEKSLGALGQYRSVVLWEQSDGSYIQLAGHGVVEAMKSRGMTEVRADVHPPSLDPMTAKRILLADNLHAMNSVSDNDDLARLLQEQQDAGFDLASLGSSDEDLRQMLEALGDEYAGAGSERDEQEDELPEQVETRAKVGDVWQLGRHRLYVGDCTNEGMVKRLMQGEKVNMILTDPPYGMNLDVSVSDLPRGDPSRVSQHPRHYKPVIGDNKDFDPTFIFDVFGDIPEVFLWGADYYADQLPHRNDGSWLVWDKRDGIEDMQWSASSFELCWSKQKHRRDIIRERWSGVLGMERQDTKTRMHPTQKPLGVMSWIIERYSQQDNAVLDLFLGSGTTLIACERTGRNCYGCEIDPHYADVALARWESHTSQTATLLERAEEV